MYRLIREDGRCVFESKSESEVIDRWDELQIEELEGDDPVEFHMEHQRRMFLVG